MPQPNIFNLPELLEETLYYLEIEESISLFHSICLLVFGRCSAPLLWRRNVELKGNDLPLHYNYKKSNAIRKLHVR